MDREFESTLISTMTPVPETIKTVGMPTAFGKETTVGHQQRRLPPGLAKQDPVEGIEIEGFVVVSDEGALTEGRCSGLGYERSPDQDREHELKQEQHKFLSGLVQP